MSTTSLGFKRVRVIALSALDLDRANEFYVETLGLPSAYEGSTQVGYLVDQTILILKDNWDVPPTAAPNSRITIETENASETEKALRARSVAISDPVKIYDDVHYVGSFLDSEGNKLWFCSYI